MSPKPFYKSMTLQGLLCILISLVLASQGDKIAALEPDVIAQLSEVLMAAGLAAAGYGRVRNSEGCAPLKLSPPKEEAGDA